MQAGGGGGVDQGPRPGRRSGTALGMIVKIILLGTALGIALFGAFPLIENRNWWLLALLVAVTGLLFLIYLSPRYIPAKYLVPGTLFLLSFQVFPVLYTISTAFTNFGDGHRGSKEDAIRAIEGSALKRVAGSSNYWLSIGVEGDPVTSDIVFLLVDRATKKVYLGTDEGLKELAAGDVQLGPTGRIARAKGYTVLNLGQASARGDAISAFRVPTEKGAIRNLGLSAAFEGESLLAYDGGCDCIRDATSGATWKADNADGYFRDAAGNARLQGWKVNVGLRNFVDVVSNPVVSRYFFGILVWNFAFAFLTVALSFALGLLIALVFNHEKLRGQRIYRSLLILPYAMPAFAMLMVWRDMFNPEYGLINRLFGLHVDWFGTPWSARAAVLMVQLWLTYPYMFLVSTGALQAIPADLTEAAQVDGARPFKAFRTITLPLLLVALAPVLIASFAFNFNNFNAIYLTSEGGPFPPDNPQAGATDLLITYTYRIAFGAQGAQYGMAAAISIFIFFIVAAVSIVGFKRTQVLEEIN
jgi:arabinogalactan oligomer / maltooligosaccharide transport system permease protein